MRYAITLILIAGLVGVATAPVGAQNATDTTNTTYVGSVDGDVQVVSEDYTDGSMTVELEADERTRLTVAKTSEVNKRIYESGGGKPPTNSTLTKTAPEGRTEISVPVEKHEGVAVVAITSQSAEVPYFAVEDESTDVDDPRGWGPIFVLIAVVFVIAVGTGFALARWWTDEKMQNISAGAQ